MLDTSPLNLHLLQKLYCPCYKHLMSITIIFPSTLWIEKYNSLWFSADHPATLISLFLCWSWTRCLTLARSGGREGPGAGGKRNPGGRPGRQAPGGHPCQWWLSPWRRRRRERGSFSPGAMWPPRAGLQFTTWPSLPPGSGSLTPPETTRRALNTQSSSR